MWAWGERLHGLLTYDFCPWANRWVYWAKQPIAVLSLAAGAALACAVFVQPLAFVPFAAILLVIALGYVWPSVAVRGLGATVLFRNHRCTEGETVEVVLSVVNRWPWPVWGLSLEEGFGDSRTVALAKVPGFSKNEFVWPFTPTCRGLYPLSVPRLTSGFPFGLRYAHRPVAVSGKLFVWPKIIPLETLLDAAETRPSDDLFSEVRVGDSGDVSGTRLFRPGDSLRRVHWAHTARLGRMIVCERQAPAQASVRVVFDSDPQLHRGVGRDGTQEWSIRIAASVLHAYHREHASVECCFGHSTWPIAAGSQGWQKFMDQLAGWQPCEEHHPTGCEHEHSHHDCRKIHHHHCGAFQVTITTDLGISHRTEHRHVHGDQRWVVLQTSEDDAPCTVCGEGHQTPLRNAIVLNPRAEGLSDQFLKKWRLACHVG